MITRVHPGNLLTATVDVGPNVDHGVVLVGSNDVGHDESNEEEVMFVLEESNGVRPSNDPDLYSLGTRRPCHNSDWTGPQFLRDRPICHQDYSSILIRLRVVTPYSRHRPIRLRHTSRTFVLLNPHDFMLTNHTYRLTVLPSNGIRPFSLGATAD